MRLRSEFMTNMPYQPEFCAGPGLPLPLRKLLRPDEEAAPLPPGPAVSTPLSATARSRAASAMPAARRRSSIGMAISSTRPRCCRVCTNFSRGPEPKSSVGFPDLEPYASSRISQALAKLSCLMQPRAMALTALASAPDEDRWRPWKTSKALSKAWLFRHEHMRHVWTVEFGMKPGIFCARSTASKALSNWRRLPYILTTIPSVKLEGWMLAALISSSRLSARPYLPWRQHPSSIVL